MVTDRMDALEDQVWADTGNAAPSPDLASPASAWVFSLVGCVGLVVSIIFTPWLGLDENLGRLQLTPSWTAIGHVPESYGELPFGPGTRGFGVAILLIALAIIVCAGVAIGRARRSASVRRLAWALEALATGCLVMVAFELTASPPFGDGPHLTFGWGALFGLVAAISSVIGTTVALVLVGIGDRHAGIPREKGTAS